MAMNNLWDVVGWRVNSVKDGDLIFVRSDFIEQSDISELRQIILEQTGKKVGIVVLPQDAEFSTLDEEDRRALIEMLQRTLVPEDTLIQVKQ